VKFPVRARIEVTGSGPYSVDSFFDTFFGVTFSDPMTNLLMLMLPGLSNRVSGGSAMPSRDGFVLQSSASATFRDNIRPTGSPMGVEFAAFPLSGDARIRLMPAPELFSAASRCGDPERGCDASTPRPTPMNRGGRCAKAGPPR
jgi:hypothetical protein